MLERTVQNVESGEMSSYSSIHSNSCRDRALAASANPRSGVSLPPPGSSFASPSPSVSSQASRFKNEGDKEKEIRRKTRERMERAQKNEKERTKREQQNREKVLNERRRRVFGSSSAGGEVGVLPGREGPASGVHAPPYVPDDQSISNTTISTHRSFYDVNIAVTARDNAQRPSSAISDDSLDCEESDKERMRQLRGMLRDGCIISPEYHEIDGDIETHANKGADSQNADTVRSTGKKVILRTSGVDSGAEASVKSTRSGKSSRKSFAKFKKSTTVRVPPPPPPPPPHLGGSEWGVGFVSPQEKARRDLLERQKKYAAKVKEENKKRQMEARRKKVEMEQAQRATQDNDVEIALMDLNFAETIKPKKNFKTGCTMDEDALKRSLARLDFRLMEKRAAMPANKRTKKGPSPGGANGSNTKENMPPPPPLPVDIAEPGCVLAVVRGKNDVVAVGPGFHHLVSPPNKTLK